MKAQQPIKRSDLARSLQACYRIEDAIWRELRTLGLTEHSRPADVRLAMPSVYQLCPAWCELEAWERIGESFVNWAETFGMLQMFWQLRRRQDQL